ncbi:hypothetical protein [Kitasatospora sp. NPDC059599]|uniref:hypothetical protein n=1 Tax=Kitasatospora sp. NPDC059599 TaxID=3346880 RepID=UPI0036D11570
MNAHQAARAASAGRLLRESGSIGRSPFYEITPYLVFRGFGYEHREALKGWNPPHIKGLTQEPEAYLLVTPAEDDQVEPANFLTHIHSAARKARTARGARAEENATVSDTHNDVRALIGCTKDLTANQRLLLVHYAALPAGKTGTQQTGQALAAEMGWAPTFFSRIRKELVEAGWLEEYDRFNNIRYYRPTDQALGRRPKVVRLRHAG